MKNLSRFVDLPRRFGDISGSGVDMFGLELCTKNRTHCYAHMHAVYNYSWP